MIPVLIAPIYTGAGLLERMLATVDEPVGTLVIVDNSRDGVTVSREDAYYISGPSSFGYPGSINVGIGQTPDAPWWLFTNHDLMWGPGDLAEIAALMEAATGPRLVTGDRSDDRQLRLAYGAVNREAVELVGLFDEWTFFPIYFDDDDYERRCRLGGVEWITYNGTIEHDRSATIRTDAAAAAANGRTFAENAQRYRAKWGGLPGAETFPTPWNLPVPLSHVPVDLAGRARRMW